MDRKSLWIGISLVVLGAFVLAVQFDVVQMRWGSLWPFLVVVPGLMFEMAFFVHRDEPAILVPGGIFTISGLNLLICNTFGWNLMSALWPLFPLAVAFGLFQLYLFDGRDRDILIAVAFLGGVGGIALLCTLSTLSVGKIIPYAIIALGVIILLRGRKNKGQYKY